MSESENAGSFSLELPEEEGTRGLSLPSNAWSVASTIYKLAESKLTAMAAANLPPRDDVLKAAGEAYDKYVKMVEDIARDAFLVSVGTLYDSVAGIVKS